MAFLNMFNLFAAVIFTALIIVYGYQMIYVLISMIHRKVKPLPDTDQKNRFAIMISARNEEGVIFELLDSLNNMHYPRNLFDIYVIADNCTDETAEVSRKHGAIVVERFNNVKKGKGYALHDLYHEIVSHKGHDYYDAYVAISQLCTLYPINDNELAVLLDLISKICEIYPDLSYRKAIMHYVDISLEKDKKNR